jgi:hypothetical protein
MHMAQTGDASPIQRHCHTVWEASGWVDQGALGPVLHTRMAFPSHQFGKDRTGRTAEKKKRRRGTKESTRPDKA